MTVNVTERHSASIEAMALDSGEESDDDFNDNLHSLNLGYRYNF